jgi:hypothetical protein
MVVSVMLWSKAPLAYDVPFWVVFCGCFVELASTMVPMLGFISRGL